MCLKEKVNPLPHPSGVTTVMVWLYDISYKNEIALYTLTEPAFSVNTALWVSLNLTQDASCGVCLYTVVPWSL